MKWTIWAPAYGKSAGVRVLHRLCHLLNLAGESAYINTHLTNPDFQTPYSELTDDSFVIYPEIAAQLSFGKKNAVVYGLNAPGALGGPVNYLPETTLIGYHNRWIENYTAAVKREITPAQIVTIGLTEKNLFCVDGNEKRFRNLAWEYKGAQLRKQYKFENENTFEMIRWEWPATRQEMAKVLRETKTLYSYDRDTALMYEAHFCGCDVVLMGLDGKPEKWRPDNLELMGMIADDENDIDKAVRFKNIVLEGKGMKKKGSEFFVAIYTNECKKYCDERFFKRLSELTKGSACHIHIVDNSVGENYYQRICNLIEEFQFDCSVTVEHVKVDRGDRKTLFQRNVTESLQVLQKAFLESSCEYFVTLETDIFPENENLFDCFLEAVNQADIIGGIYYAGFHSMEDFLPENNELVLTHHVLSGCTLYKRKVLKKYNFRWSTENLAAFPDAWMSFDAGKKFVLANYRKIKCLHMTKADGSRGQGDLK